MSRSRSAARSTSYDPWVVVERRWSATTKRIVLLAIVVAAAILVVRAWEIVPPFIWAFVVGYALLPGVAFFETRGLRRGPAAAIVFLILVAAIVVAIRVAAPVAIGQVHDFQRAFPATLHNAQTTAASALNDLGMGDLNAIIFAEGTLQVSQNVGRMLLPIAQAIGRFAVELLIFLIATFFVLRDSPRLFSTMQGIVPRGQRAEVLHIAGQISSLIARYIRGQLILVVVMSTATAIGLSLLEVPYSVILGVLTGVLELIPFVGPITAGAIASIIALGHGNPFGWTQLQYVAAVVIMYTVFRHTEDYVVIPLVIGRIVRLHPVVIIFSVLAGGAVLGLLGVILAVPLAATARLLLVYVLAKLRDEDPLAQLTREMEAVEGHQDAPTAEARAVPGEAGS